MADSGLLARCNLKLKNTNLVRSMMTGTLVPNNLENISIISS
jgi:hypothetical protein